MTVRSKTVEFAYDVDTNTLAANTKRTFTGNTIYLPESSITFRSVTLIGTWGDDGTTAASPTNWILGIKLGAAGESTATVTDTMTNSGEAWSMRYRRDVTSYFTTNWSGTSMTWEASVQQAGATTRNHSIKLVITYEYDDTSTTHVKTIRIPVESTRTLLTTTWQTIGGATAIPAIGGSYLPEASVTVRQVWVELWGQEATLTTTDFILQARVNGGTAIDWWSVEASLNSARWAYGIVDITSQDLSAARSLEGLSSGQTNRGGTVGGMIVVTYEFAPGSSSTIYNSIIVGAVDTIGSMAGTASGNEDQWARDIYIAEPSTITMKESGVCLFFNDNSGFTANVAVGSQTDTAFVNTAGTLQCGQFSLVHRIDANGANGTAGMTLARGKNAYSIQFRSTTAGAGWNLSGFMILNYTSGKASAGVGVHAQTRYFHLADTAADSTFRQVNDVTTVTIPESQYWLVGAVVDLDAAGTTGAGGLALQFERTSGLGWEPAYAGIYRGDSELNLMTPFGSSKAVWKRWPGDLDPDRADIETGRDWRLDTQPTAWAGWGIWATWHAHSWTIAGTVSGYADADGAGLTVGVHRASTGEKVLELTTTTGGDFTTPWGDDTEDMYVEVFENSTHVGRSANSTAA